MINSIIEFSIRRRWLVTAAGLLLGLFGTYAAWRTPIDAIPDLSENQVIVFTDWQGHDPAEIDERITRPIAGRLRGISGTRTIRTSSDQGYSSIHVIFEDGIDQGSARRAVAERLSAARAVLPAGAITKLAPDGPATGQIFWYVLEGGDLDLGERRKLQDEQVGPQLAKVNGVAEVASVGGFTTEVAIEVDPSELVARGIALTDIDGVVRSQKHIGASDPGEALAKLPIRGANGQEFPLGKIASIGPAPGPRRGVLEKDGSEAVGGVVLMSRGENPLEVTRRLYGRIDQLQASLPRGVRIVTGYDRTPLIRGAVGTVTRTLIEAVLTATLCVLVVLLHVRSSLVIAITLPLATVTAFAILWTLRALGWLTIDTNIMTLAGLAISVGVLVDSSIVMTENVMHRLRLRFGDRPVNGDIQETVREACLAVGRPIFFSVAIMLLSFVPVFALGGMAGKMFLPLAAAKSLAMLAAAVLAISVVPALCAIFIRGRIRGEHQNWLVTSVAGVYRPVLSYLLDRPGLMLWIMGATFLCGFAPLGIPIVTQLTLLAVLIAVLFVVQGWKRQTLSLASLILVALAAQQIFQPLPRAFLTPLDEGTVMDMPITVPGIAISQATDDLKARDMILCRFPEVEMVMGKVGRADTATDPAPLDMIETMVSFRPRQFWPRRKLQRADALAQSEAALAALIARGLLAEPAAADERQSRLQTATDAALFTFDAQLREFACQRQQEKLRELRLQLVDWSLEHVLDWTDQAGKLSSTEQNRLRTAALEQMPLQLMGPLSRGEAAGIAHRLRSELISHGKEPAPPAAASVFGDRSEAERLHDALADSFRREWSAHVAQLDDELAHRGAELYTRVILEELLAGGKIVDAKAAEAFAELRRIRFDPAKPLDAPATHHGVPVAPLPDMDPVPGLNEIQSELSQRFARTLILWRKDKADLAAPGGEFDTTLQVPGWANVWTMPIQNRVDMLSTGVNTDIGICVLGSRLDDVVRTSEQIASVVKRLPGASGVIADPVRGQGTLHVKVNPASADRFGIGEVEARLAREAALGGAIVTKLGSDAPMKVRLRLTRDWRRDVETIGNVPLLTRSAQEREPPGFVRLGQVAQVEMVEAPVTLKGENGELRNYVRLNVRGRDASEFVAEARRAVAEQVALPAGVHLEWTGQFEHQRQAYWRLAILIPAVVLTILLLLWWTYHDLADALLMMLAVPGAIAGGVLLQWLMGETLSITVVMGYIACFGMATATGVIMLVYLREAIENAGGLANLSEAGLRQAVLDGAVHRLRPKLLTEATTIIGLAPMLWAHGVGAEVIRPMVVPVLGGILVADEVIDLFLPVMFYWVRRRRLAKLRAEEASAHENQKLPVAA